MTSQLNQDPKTAATPQTIKELVVIHNAHLQVISMCSEQIRGKLFGENPQDDAPEESVENMPIASVLQRNTQLLLQIKNMLEKINDEI